MSTAVWTLVVVLALPAIAELTQRAVPWLVAVIVVLALVRLWWPVRRR
jgi:predicted ABC-type exoprotein transport system permease subunit